MSFPRYESYKDSGVEWLGNVPEHWELKRLKRNLRLLTEKTARRENPVALENIESWSGRFIQTETKFEGEGIAFERGDILFGKLRPYLAKVYLADTAGEAVGDFHVMRPTKGIDSRFSQYQILNREFIAIVDGSTFGAKMPRVSWDFLSNMVLTTPPIPEQQTIAAFLNRETAKIDALIAEQKRLIELLKEKRQAVISHAVTKGLNPNAPIKDSGIEWLGEVPEPWDVMQLRRITNLQQGLQIPQENRFEEDGENRFEYITIRSINAGSDRVHKEFIESPSDRVICYKTDILLARTGATGEVITNVSGVFHNNFFKINYDEMFILRDYLVYFLKVNEVKNHLLILAGTTTIPDLNHGAFLSTSICLPDKQEQDQICKYLDEKLTEFDLISCQGHNLVDLLKERRTALISAAVTGKIDVRKF